MTVVGLDEASLVTALREPAGVGVNVLEVGTYDCRYGIVIGGLTGRQFEAVEAAIEMGYYATLRTVSLSAVADELGVAEATPSELLRRAESRLMPRLINTTVQYRLRGRLASPSPSVVV